MNWLSENYQPTTNAKVMISMSNQRSTPYAPYLYNTFQISYSPLASHPPHNPSKNKNKAKKKRKRPHLEGRKKNPKQIKISETVVHETNLPQHHEGPSIWHLHSLSTKCVHWDLQ